MWDASAHSNCILNNLKSKTVTHSTNASVKALLMEINGMNTNLRKKRMSNVRVQQIVTLLYTHKMLVECDEIENFECEKLREIMKRVNKHYDYYKTNPMIKSTLDFLKLVVDNWFETG